MCSDDTVRIPLRARDGSVRAYALIDAADAEWVNQWRWHLDASGYAATIIREAKRQYSARLHRLLLGLSRGDGIDGDHINRDRLDNRRANLRTGTRGQNLQNVKGRQGGTSNYRGVFWVTSRNKWYARVQINGRCVHVGAFDDETEAANAARSARARLMPYATD